MTFEPDPDDLNDDEFNERNVDYFTDELAGLDVEATLANPRNLSHYRRSIEYGRDGRPLHELDRLANPPGSDRWPFPLPEDGLDEDDLS
ncbi:hypothetical protein [Rhodococcus marinonascens]|uniref:hypothetical protein n=1 Tax=Rhodococcus marinonascens TaxID=38311 RepID=UPI000933D4E4|nr:hypothetical protein [Rhodococcus marinonascens]